MSPISTKKILIMKFRNIGDVLLITPLVSNLKESFPDAQITVAVNKGTEDMISLNDKIDNIIIYDREKIKSYKVIKRVIEEIKFASRIKKEHYDLVINTTRGDRGTILSLISMAKTKIGYESKNKFLKNIFSFNLPKFNGRHMVDVNLDALNYLQVPIKNKKVEIFWSQKDMEKVDSLLTCKDFIHVHPVSRWLFKCIDDKTMAAIIDFCEDTLKRKVVLTAAPIKKELDKISSILKFCKSNPINLSGKLSLKQTAYLNKKSKFFVGVDTAIMHISAANDIPVLAFFGPSAVFHWGPWDNSYMDSSYVKDKGNQSMGKHIVLQKDWDCVPCVKDGCNGSKISDCLINLDIEKIRKEIIKLNE